MQQAREMTSLHYLMPSNTGSYQNGYSMISHSNTTQYPISNRCSHPLYNLQSSPQIQEFSPPSSCFSSNSTSDEAEEQQQQQSLISERKKRRMISNRESARRSRMRKQRHLDELWSQVMWLRNENHQLLNKLNHASESHERAVQENVQLKEEASELREMLSDMQLRSPFSTFRDLEDIACNTDFLRADDSSNPSIDLKFQGSPLLT